MSSIRYGLASEGFGEEEISAAIRVLKSGHYTMGETVLKFEREFAEWVGARHAVMVNSGSSGNLIAIDSLMRPYHRARARFQPGDEVLVPALAWPTTVWPLVQLGLVPVFVDIDLETLGLSLESARRNLSPKTKGMILIHVMGQACPMREYVSFCERNGLTLVEDCCESFGAFDSKTHVGLFGAVGTFSHYYSHHLTTIEGGTVVTNNSELADDLRSQREHGWSRSRSDQEAIKSLYPGLDPRFLFVTTGYNVRPMEIQAAIGSVQLQRMDSLLARREAIAKTIHELARRHAPWMNLVGSSHCSGVTGARNERRHSWMGVPFILEKSAPVRMEKLKEIFEKSGVETRPIIAGNLAKHPVAKNIHARFAPDLSTCDRALRDGFLIGCNPECAPAAMRCLEDAFKAAASL